MRRSAGYVSEVWGRVQLLGSIYAATCGDPSAATDYFALARALGWTDDATGDVAADLVAAGLLAHPADDFARAAVTARGVRALEALAGVDPPR